MRKLRSGVGRPSPAMMVALLALFVALGSSSYAALTITGKNVKDGTLASADLKDNSVRSADIRDGSLLSKDFKAGQLPVGAQGAKGDTGAQGPQGPPGPPGVTGVFISTGGPGSDEVFCEPGEVAVGGGGISTDGFLSQSQPLPFNVDVPAIGWKVGAKKADGSAAMVTAWVVCASP